MKFIYRPFIIISALLLFCLLGNAQTKVITGKVVSIDDAKPLQGVSILIQGSAIGTSTNSGGEFSINVKGSDVLVFTFVGYKTQLIAIGDKTNLEVFMQPAAENLGDVVIVGYGTQKKTTFTGAVSTVNQGAIDHNPSSNVATALQGTLPGLRVQQSTGQPGSSPTIAFRGGSDFSGNGTPLFIVDGVIVPSLYGLDMNDVASIDLLKDAATAAIYGARAANGVVLP